MQLSFIRSTVLVCVALAGVGCDSEDDTSGSGAQGGAGGHVGEGGSSGVGGQGGDDSAGGSGGGVAECLSCADAMTAIENGRAQGKICDDPASTQLFFNLAQCYCSEPVCGGATGPCATVCDPEPDPDVSQECIDCVVDSLSGACETQAQACATDS